MSGVERRRLRGRLGVSLLLVVVVEGVEEGEDERKESSAGRASSCTAKECS